MSNPVFSRLETEWDKEASAQNAAAAAQAAKLGQHPGYDQRAFQEAQAAYEAPAADAVDTGRMTVDDVIVKTLICLVTAFAFAAGAWWLTSTYPTAGMAVMSISFIAGFVVAMVNIFSRSIKPALVLLYSALEGAALGALSYVTNAAIPGVVLQAVIATFAVFFVTLALFTSGKVRNSPKMQKFVLIGLIGLIVSRLAIWLLGLIGLPVYGIYDQQIFGIPLGVFISVFAVIMGALSLIGDFDQVRVGVQQGVPAKFAWSSAFGIMVTLIWLYVEILNLLSRLNSRSN